jgi:hypothetical protein
VAEARKRRVQDRNDPRPLSCHHRRQFTAALRSRPCRCTSGHFSVTSSSPSSRPAPCRALGNGSADQARLQLGHCGLVVVGRRPQVTIDVEGHLYRHMAKIVVRDLPSD